MDKFFFAKVAIVVLFITLVHRKMDWDQDHLDVDERLPTIYWDPDTLDTSAPDKGKAVPPKFDDDWLEPLRQKRMQEGEMNTVITDIVVYMVYLFIVVQISYGNRDANAYGMKTNILDTVVHGGILCGRPDEDPCDPDDYPEYTHPLSGATINNRWKDFYNVRDTNQWWTWLHSTLLPNVRVQNWYNGDPPYGLRGYMDDRVNRIIGYAIVRQIRERVGTCRTPILLRDYVDSCTGDMMMGQFDEDYRYYCMDWLPLIHENCTRMTEYEFKSQEKREARPLSANYRTYSGGGYELKFRGQIAKLNEKLVRLEENNWIDNRTRALITELTVYNPQVIEVAKTVKQIFASLQVNLFGIIKIVGEFNGGGIHPFHRIEVTSIFDVLQHIFKGSSIDPKMGL